ncbi:hypothetical protein [Arthrobacter pityocampae]|uniref:hypothetical protein n=1 Tax=Arthrobacter pityocampae TaxID=547334 RepID=UPI00373683AB
METVAPYAKFVVAILGAGTTAALGLIAPDTDLFVVLTVLAAMLTSAGVLMVPNVPDSNGKHQA